MLRLTLVVLFLMIPTTQATAAVLTHISWDVTGGSLSWGLNPGGPNPVVGGSLQWTLPGGGLVTPGTASNGTWSLSVYTTSGAAFILGGAAGGGFAQVNSNTVAGNLVGVPSGFVFLPYFGSLATFNPGGRGFSVVGGNGVGNFAGSVAFFTPSLILITTSITGTYTLGNEVRTIAAVPEPRTGTMLGIGLMGFALAAAWTARRRVA